MLSTTKTTKATKADYSHLDSPLHREWNEFRLLKNKMGSAKAWRSFVGVGMLPCGETAMSAGGKVMAKLNFLSLWDLPPGSVDDPAMGRRDVCWGSVASPEIVENQLELNFHGGFDFRFIPQPNPRGEETLNCEADSALFAAFNVVNKKMTESAFYTRDKNDRFVNRPWAQKRPDDSQKLSPVAPSEWMPTPYVRITAGQRDSIDDRATRFESKMSLQCKSCDALTDMRHWSEPEFSDDAQTFCTTCKKCNESGEYTTDDIVDGNARRYFTSTFKAMYCADAALGLPIRAPEEVVYAGSRVSGSCQVVTFETEAGVVYREEIPANIKMPGIGSTLSTGMPMFHLLQSHKNTSQLASNAKLGVKRQWAGVRDFFESREEFHLSVRLWCKYQAVCPDGDEPGYLFPLRLVMHQVPSEEIYWDVTNVLEHLDESAGIIVPPPILQSRQDQLEFQVSGLKLKLANPRFKV